MIAVQFLVVVVVLAFVSSSAFRVTGGRSAIGSRLSMSIKKIQCREIIDSRGNPTTEVDVTTEKGMFRASCPSGASTGAYEACELRDGDKNRYNGKGVLRAVNNVLNTLAPALLGKDETEQELCDQIMLDIDGTPNKVNMGANAILCVSLAISKAGAAARGVPLYQHYGKFKSLRIYDSILLAPNFLLSGALDSPSLYHTDFPILKIFKTADLAGNKDLVMPVPSFNVINGGSHAGNGLAFQEFMVLPTGAESFSHAMQVRKQVYSDMDCYNSISNVSYLS
jgi:enolase